MQPLSNRRLSKTFKNLSPNLGSVHDYTLDLLKLHYIVLIKAIISPSFIRNSFIFDHLIMALNPMRGSEPCQAGAIIKAAFSRTYEMFY